VPSVLVGLDAQSFHVVQFTFRPLNECRWEAEDPHTYTCTPAYHKCVHAHIFTYLYRYLSTYNYEHTWSSELKYTSICISHICTGRAVSRGLNPEVLRANWLNSRSHILNFPLLFTLLRLRRIWLYLIGAIPHIKKKNSTNLKNAKVNKWRAAAEGFKHSSPHTYQHTRDLMWHTHTHVHTNVHLPVHAQTHPVIW